MIGRPLEFKHEIVKIKYLTDVFLSKTDVIVFKDIFKSTLILQQKVIRGSETILILVWMGVGSHDVLSLKR